MINWFKFILDETRYTDTTLLQSYNFSISLVRSFNLFELILRGSINPRIHIYIYINALIYLKHPHRAWKWPLLTLLSRYTSFAANGLIHPLVITRPTPSKRNLSFRPKWNKSRRRRGKSIQFLAISRFHSDNNVKNTITTRRLGPGINVANFLLPREEESRRSWKREVVAGREVLQTSFHAAAWLQWNPLWDLGAQQTGLCPPPLKKGGERERERGEGEVAGT